MEIRREGHSVVPDPVRREWPEGFISDLLANAHIFRDLEVPEPQPPGGTDVSLDEM